MSYRVESNTILSPLYLSAPSKGTHTAGYSTLHPSQIHSEKKYSLLQKNCQLAVIIGMNFALTASKCKKIDKKLEEAPLGPDVSNQAKKDLISGEIVPLTQYVSKSA